MVGGTVASALTTPYSAAVVTLVYFDLRVRKEGLDLQLLAADAGVERDPDAPLPAPLVADEYTPEERAEAPYWPPPPGWTPPSRARAAERRPAAEPEPAAAGWRPAPEAPPQASGWLPPRRAAPSAAAVVERSDARLRPARVRAPLAAAALARALPRRGGAPRP